MPQEVKQNVVEQFKTEEKEQQSRQSAAEGARAVADAVTKVANAAAEAATAAARGQAVGDFIITGTPGGKFEIRSLASSSANGFSSSGSVLIGGVAQHTDEWGALYIRGKLNADVKSGEVVVQIDANTKKTGYLKV